MRIEFNSEGKVRRKFTEEWRNSGLLNLDKLPEYIGSFVEQQKSMVDYIELLHDKLDFIMEKNGICDVGACHTANCDSDHK